MSVVRTPRGWVAASPAWSAAPDACPDEMLIRRIADGDQLAMRTFFGGHQVAVYHWLLRLLADEALAEDLLSEASFEARSSVSTWLLSMARHKALSARQRAVDVELNEDAVAKLPDTEPDTEDDPGRVLQNTDRAEALRHALPRLSPQLSEVIDLVYYHGKSVKEVAEIVGADEATVKTSMFNARRQLAELVELRTYRSLRSANPRGAHQGHQDMPLRDRTGWLGISDSNRRIRARAT
jgi:RNA polymerase sigma-70 factor (ECF subfamily)